MSNRKKNTKTKTVETLTHTDDKRSNIPTAELQPVMENDEPIPVTYERNRDLDPQFVWRGKDEQDWSDLVVQAPPLFIQEKVHPKVLIDDLVRQSQPNRETRKEQLDLFADFNGLPSEDAKTEFYQHDANWSNRMILGDSLHVMASLAECEGLRGKVQCIYIDPPYGIKFNSNFQWSTTSRDVKDGKTEHITREPEQVKAFRDTWRDGIHSYLTYLRDRLTVARDLLTESGSIFVQIGDENLHRVRALMDEVFGEGNFCVLIAFTKTSSQTSQLPPAVSDYVIWYCKDPDFVKIRTLCIQKDLLRLIGNTYQNFEHDVGTLQVIRRHDIAALLVNPGNIKFVNLADLTSQTGGVASQFAIEYSGVSSTPKGGRGWRTDHRGMTRLCNANRLHAKGSNIFYKQFLSDYPITPLSSQWDDTQMGGFLKGEQRIYVVQTTTKVIQRCVLMTTDPGDLVLDPTCGSGTTAYVAEQWGRRWITIDTSRVALALARARIMGARYDYYLLSDSSGGQLKEAEIQGKIPSEAPTYGDIRQGFVYERVPHITLKSIANNAEIDVIWERYEEELAPLRSELSEVCGLANTLEEWEIPRERPDNWSAAAEPLLADFWDLRVARQKKIDASIADKAEYEYLYDKPYVDKKKARVAGPFTVESLSPHRVLGVDEDDELIDNLADAELGYGEKQDFAGMILEHLKTSGVQQTHKEDRISFSSIKPWPGDLVCAEGRYVDDDSDAEKRAAIFIGPEFGTVSRVDLVEAAREAADADFDVLIACAFSYEAHSTDFHKLGKIPVLKARMNADLHMAADLSNTGKGNLFVIFGEPDISVVSGQWLVTRKREKIVNYEQVKELSGLGSLEKINRVGRDGLSNLCRVSAGGEVRHNQPSAASSDIGISEYRGGIGTSRDRGVSAVSGGSERLSSGDGDVSDPSTAIGDSQSRTNRSPTGSSGGNWTDAQRSKTLTAIENLTDADFPLLLTTDHWTQVTVIGVDVFHPNTGEIRSDDTDGIACWFIDTDYNSESFFVRHAYFLGANDPYKSLKTTLKAEINHEAWESLHSDTSRPFKKPESGRIAVKIINHLGDEVMKVFRL